MATVTNYHKLGGLTEMYSLKLLEARSLNLVSPRRNEGVSRAMLAGEALGETLFLASSGF